MPPSVHRHRYPVQSLIPPDVLSLLLPAPSEKPGYFLLRPPCPLNRLHTHLHWNGGMQESFPQRQYLLLKCSQMHLQAQPAPSLAGTLLPLQADVSRACASVSTFNNFIVPPCGMILFAKVCHPREVLWIHRPPLRMKQKNEYRKPSALCIRS